MRAASIIRTVAIVAAFALAAASFGMWQSGRASHRSDLVGMFKDASPLDPGSEVRAAGVKVGTVRSIELRDGLAAVTLDVDKSVLPVHDDATLTIRPINVLGEHYVDINEGSATRPMLASGVIKESATESSVTLQDVLDTLDRPTATGLAGLVETLGTGVEGNGAVLAEALRKLAPSMASARQVGQLLDGQIDTLQRIVDQVRPISSALASGRGQTLDKLVGNTTETLTAVASQQRALDSSIVQLPATLDTVVTTLNELSAVSSSATPLLRSARPLTDNLRSVSHELSDFTHAADPALAAVQPVLGKARGLLKEAGPIASELDASGNDLRGAAQGLRPIGNQVLDRNLYGLMQFVRQWALSTNSRDGLSHYFRGVFHLSPAALKSLVGGGSTELKPRHHLQAGPQTPTDLLGNVLGDSSALADLSSTINGLLQGILPKPSAYREGALGLSEDQETNLLTQLLGGL